SAFAGGRIGITAGVFVNVGAVRAGGAGGGGTLTVEAGNVLNAGVLSADGSAGPGGSVRVRAAGTYVDTAPARATGDRPSRATAAGPGGTVVVWSDGHTRFAGSVSARGGPGGGAGGWLEVSSAGQLDYAGSADAGAAAGPAGALLLDPHDLVLSATTGALPQY